MTTLNMDRIVERLRSRGVDARIDHSGGGFQTIYVGPTHEQIDWMQPDGPPETRYAALAGPGYQESSRVFGWTGEFCVGRDDDGEGPATFPTTEDEAVEAVMRLLEEVTPAPTPQPHNAIAP